MFVQQAMNYYELLSIKQDHPQELIPQAFRTQIKQVHPDKNQQTASQIDHKEATIRLYEAYRVLNDPARRKQYDDKLKYSEKAQEIATHRYFEEANLIHEAGKWYVQCEQCLGKTEIQPDALENIHLGNNNCFIKCWHCNLSLSLFIDQ